MKWWSLANVTLLLASFSPNAKGSTCFGASFQMQESNFEYVAYLKDVECDLSNTNVTTLYMLGACCKGHSNNFGPVPPDCHPGDWNVMNNTSAACRRVFATASGGPNVRKVREMEIFDRGQVCSDGLYGVIFVETDCSSLTADSVVVQQRFGSRSLCWGGHTLSEGGLAGIILGSVFGVLLVLVLPVAICGWRWRRQRQKDLQEIQGLQAKSPFSQEIVKVADSVFVSKQNLPGSSLYASHLLYPIDSQAYDIELETAPSDEAPERMLPLSTIQHV